jgi:hypothetical protein
MSNFSEFYTRLAVKQASLAQMMKAARCWSGYEPVPGKAPYSEDSCRPAGSKKKKDAAKEKKAAMSSFTASKRPTMTQMAPKPAEPPVKPRVAPKGAPPYVSLGQRAAEEAAAKRPPDVGTMVKMQSAGLSPAQAAKAAASSVYRCATKTPEAVVDSKKPTSIGQEHKVTRPEPAQSEDLRPEEVQPSKS